MKALSIASLIALGIAGTACSQDADAKAEDTQTTEAAPEAADVGGSFNLGLPTDTAATADTSGFNLALPSDAPASTDGFNLAAGVSASNGLSELPEISTDIVQADETALSDVLETEATDDEPVIRLD
ncbi:MAG: hypothetical protein AAFQ15_01620 [Pseudomonadota bacterium]